MSAIWPYAADRPARSRSSGSFIFRDDDSASDGPAACYENLDDEAGANSPQRRHGRRAAPSPLPLHERTPSQNNRMSGIRIVPYSPPRLVADSETHSIAASASSSPRRRLFLVEDDGDENDATDSIRTTATAAAAKQAKRSSRSSRGSWGSLIAATAAAAASLTSSSSVKTPSRKSSSKGSNRTVGGRIGKKAGNGSSSKKEKEGYAASEQGSATPTTVDGGFLLASASTRDVSGPKPAINSSSPTDSDDNWQASATSATLLRSPVDVSSSPLVYRNDGSSRLDRPALLPLSQDYAAQNNSSNSSSSIYAPSAYSEFSASPSLPASPALAALPLPPFISASAFPPLSPSASVSSLVSASSSQLAPRPNSRRHNQIAVHSDKTFSLVSLVPPASAATSPNISLLADPASILKSPPLSFSSTTLRSSDSHERFSSGIFSSEDLTSSPLSTSATVPDRSSLTPFAPSPGSSTVHFAAGSPRDTGAADPSAASSWNYRLSSSLRKTPKTPELKQKSKGKGKGRAVSPVSSSYRLQPAYHSHQHNASSALDNTVFLLPPLAESSPVTTVETVAAFSSPADRLPKKKTSFASEQSAGALSTASSLSFVASTVSATTNYKVYAHSLSPVAHESSDSLGFAPSSSAGSFNDVGNTTNIEILGRSSPPAPSPARLPVLRRTVDPDQTFSSLASFDENESILSSPNVVILGASSPPAALPFRRVPEERSSSVDLSSSPPFPPQTAATEDSEPNYVLYGEPSTISVQPPRQLPPTASSAASSLVTVSRQPWPAYSQESLVVRPLQPVRKRSNEKFGYFRSRSRESLRHAASIKSISSVILSQEATSVFFAGQAFLNLNIPPVPVFTAPKTKAKVKSAPPVSITTTVPRRKPVPSLLPPIEDRVLERTPSPPMRSDRGDRRGSSPLLSPSPSGSSSPSLPQQPQQPQQQPRSLQMTAMVEEHAHQWSSQLSTVMSESEVESMHSRAGSRSCSVSAQGVRTVSGVSVGGTSGRRSSVGGWATSSTHSHNMPSISSSLALQLEDTRSRRSRSESLLPERPQAAYTMARSSNSASPAPMRTTIVRDQDEDGDGLADLHDVMLRQPQSRSALSAFFSSSNSSSRNLHSSGSSRSLGSPIPAWARVYYGSGERKYLAASLSDASIGGDDLGRRGSAASSRPASIFRRSPSADRMGSRHIFNARRRPREMGAGGPAGERPFSDAASMEMGEAGESGAGGVLVPGQYRTRGLRQVTSSLWSPHLRTDRRATRFSVWDPPSMSWSAETGSLLNRRSTQIIAFTVGFIFPFAWMVAAFLPLPPDPKRAMEKQNAEGEFGMPAALKQRITQADEARFQSARWWRTLNRAMSLLGILILGAIVALVVVGVQQHWAQ